MAGPRFTRSRLVFLWLIRLLQFHLTSFLVALTLTLMPTLGESHDSTDSSTTMTTVVKSLSDLSNLNQTTNSSSGGYLGSLDGYNSTGGKGLDGSGVHRTATIGQNGGVPKEFPTALVIASSIAAVSILIFFFVSYYWHTHQLDSRARKLAIRMAADAEHNVRCSNCNQSSRSSAATPTPSRTLNRGYIRAASDSSQEPNTCEVLTIDEDKPEVTGGSVGAGSSVVVSESDTADAEDVFEPSDIPQLTRSARGSIRGIRGGGGGGGGGASGGGGGGGAAGGGHRKWSRSRKSSGPPLEGKRDSAVTDKEILTHFASRRHSTFFI